MKQEQKLNEAIDILTELIVEKVCIKLNYINEHIEKLKNGKYRILSKKKHKGQSRNLGTSNSLVAAKKREKQIQFFRNKQ